MTHKTDSLQVLHHTVRLGPMVLARHGAALCGVWFADQRHFPRNPQWQELARDPLLEQAAQQIDAYLAGTRTQFDLPLSLHLGTAFQQTVWQALLGIACGQTLGYAALAQRLGQPRAVRAVAAAVGRNPLSLVVPCHRVLGSDGSLTGYAGGLERKAALLQLERSYV
jgi:methylated-DNA-[protein]-cysteine S-methyltransferase